MWLILFRVFIVALLTQAGHVYSPVPGDPWTGAALGCIAALAIIGLEIKLRSVPAHQLVGGLVGGVTGLFGARLLWGAMSGLDLVAEHFVHALLIVFLVYMGLVIGTRKGEWFEPARIIAAFKDSAKLHLYKVLDTSVIIDGRIADICETGFLEGTLVVPQFVLRELQQVADSSDSLKRNRGRRGLDILAKIQKMSGVSVQIVETDFPDIREVDLKLIELARRMSGKIVTNDFNLNKVAQLRGVPVLNINELTNSLKPVVLPGEVLRVFVIKEGKESGQGTVDAGHAAALEFLKRVKVPAESWGLSDGSGLSRSDLVTAHGLVSLLAAMDRHPLAPVFRQSLAEPGQKGTLENRLRRYHGRLFAKTGTLRQANALAGYATAADGDRLAFAVLINNHTVPSREAVAAIDDIVGIVLGGR